MNWIKWAFWPLLLLACTPIFRHGHFPTLDGPAMLYNAQVWSELWSGSGVVHEFFDLNSYPVPYLMTHVLFLAVSSFFEAPQTEVVLWLMYAVGLAVSFRRLVRSIRGHASPMDWLGILFIYSMPMRMGFVNFCFGLVILLLLLAHIVRSKGAWTTRVAIGVGCYALLLYFTHLFLLGLGGAVAFSIWCWLRWQSGIAFSWKALLGWVVVVLPAISLALGFLGILNSGHAPVAGPVVGNTWIAISDLSPLITLAYDPQVLFTRFLFWCIAISTVVLLVDRSRGRSGIQPSDGFGLIAILLLISLFALPDAVMEMSWMSNRILLIGFVMWVVWLASQEWRMWFQIALSGLLLVGTIGLFHQQDKLTQALSVEADVAWQASHVIPSGSVVLPINHSRNWMHANFASYLGVGAEGDLVILDNLHATVTHGPSRWKPSDPYLTYGDQVFSLQPCVDLLRAGPANTPKVDIVSIWHPNEVETDSCTIGFRRQLRELADTLWVSEGEELILFQIK